MLNKVNKIAVVLIWIFFFYAAPSFSQSFFLKGQIKDSKTHQVIDNVAIVSIESRQVAVSNTEGHFTIVVEKLPTQLEFSKVGYERQRIFLNEADTTIKIYLKTKVTELAEVPITASKAKPLLTEKVNLDVFDYVVTNGKVLMIVYRNNLYNAWLALLDELTNDTINTFRLKEKPESLYKDCMGNAHLITYRNAYQVNLQNSRIALMDTVLIEKFNTMVRPCVIENKANYFFKQLDSGRIINVGRLDVKTNHHLLNYYCISKETKTSKLVSTVSDGYYDTMAEDARFRRDKKIAGSYGNNPMGEAGDVVFREKLLYKEIFAPMFSLNDTLFLFDYTKGYMECYNAVDAGLIKKTPIAYHKDVTWKAEMYMDGAQHKIYGKFEKNGVVRLKEINLNSWLAIEKPIKLERQFIDNIQIFDDTVYFIYKDNDALAHFALYKQKLEHE